MGPELQWGRGRSTAESRRRRRASPSPSGFNGAAVVRPRREADEGVLGIESTSFNGAAVVRPRREAHRRALRARSWGFNGAAVVRPRRERSCGSRAGRARELQWGRGRSTAESPRERVRVLARRRASMGPRSFDRGEDRRGAEPGRASPGFNGAAVVRPRRARARESGNRTRCGFNGAAVVRPRRDGQRGVADPLVGASMGPRSFDRGERPQAAAASKTAPASMGPRSFDRGEPQVRSGVSIWSMGFNGAAVVRPRRAA